VPSPSTNPFLIVAVDGGAASGKSSLARALAEKFGFLHVDTGAYYRTLTLALRKAGVAAEDAAGVTAALARPLLGTQIEGRAARLSLDGCAPDSTALRSEEVNAQVSRFAAQPAVRHYLLDYQRSQAQVAGEHGFSGLVMEGRDIGSVIFPNAGVKLFLTADPATRARRRAAEGQTDAVAERDRIDSTRAVSPLTCPPGATVIDSSHLTLDEVVTRASAIVEAARRPISHPV
jgi:cytidylate kinase